MNIGLLTSYLATSKNPDSGLGQHFRILADALSEEGHKVHVIHIADNRYDALAMLRDMAPAWSYEVVCSSPPSIVLSFLKRSWPCQFLSHLFWQSRAADAAVLTASRRYNISVIETHAYNMPAMFLLRRRRRPKVVTRVSTTSAQMLPIMPVRSRVLKLHAQIERAASNWSDALVTHSVNHRDTICGVEGYRPDRFTIIPHGLPDPGSPGAPPKDNPEIVNFLFVGRFEPRKGVDVLLEAIPMVVALYPKARFTLAGAKDEDVWRKFTLQHPIIAERHTQCLGRVSPDRLTELYRQCDVLVAPSRYESFGLIYAEAMSHGRASIGCNVGGIPEVISDGETGLLVGPGDTKALATAMIRLAQDSRLRVRMGKTARVEYLRRFSANQMALASARFYSRISR